MEKEAGAARSILSALKSPVAKKIAIGTAGAGALATAGVVGHKIGVRSGATRTANAMASAFSQANAKENQKIVDSFNTFNKMENAEIAKGFYRKGITEGAKMIKKSAYIDEIYDNAFNEELEKVGKGNWIGSKMSTLAKSFSNLGKAVKFQKAKPGSRWKALKGSKAALGTIGAGALGAGAIGAGLASD